MSRLYYIIIFAFTLGVLFVACSKMPQETIPLPQGESLQKEPITKAQWDALNIEDGQWVSEYCLRKQWGSWEEYPETVTYRFSLPDEVEYIQQILSGRQGQDGTVASRASLKWRFDEDDSSLVIITSEEWKETYTVLDAGADSFYLLRNVKQDGDLLSSVSWILYKFVRV